jgi:hypothetical protein
MFIPDPGSEFFPSRIPDLGFFYPGSRIRIKEFKYFNPKNCFLSSRKYDPGCSSRIRILTFYPSRIPDPGVKKAPDPGSGFATLNAGQAAHPPATQPRIALNADLDPGFYLNTETNLDQDRQNIIKIKEPFRPSSTVGLQCNQPSTLHFFLLNVDPNPGFF